MELTLKKESSNSACLHEALLKTVLVRRTHSTNSRNTPGGPNTVFQATVWLLQVSIGTQNIPRRRLRSPQPSRPLQGCTIVSKSQLYKISEHFRIFSPAPMLENFEGTQIGVIHSYNHMLCSPLLFLMRCRIVVDPLRHNL